MLIAGCAHNGIVNIIERYMAIKGHAPDVVIGGFHLMGGKALHEQLDVLTEQLANKLKRYPSRFYTNHCTGQRAFAILRDIMGKQISYLAGGDTLEIS